MKTFSEKQASKEYYILYTFVKANRVVLSDFQTENVLICTMILVGMTSKTALNEHSKTMKAEYFSKARPINYLGLSKFHCRQNPDSLSRRLQRCWNGQSMYYFQIFEKQQNFPTATFFCRVVLNLMITTLKPI